MPTCFEIYETYQRGPAAVLRLFEEALGTRAIYGPPPPDTQQRTIDSLSDEIGRLKRQVSRLKAALGEAMRELFGCAMSAGTLSSAVRRCAARLVETELKIKRGLRRSAVIHADETGLRVNKKLAYVHVASSARLTHYAADARRGKAAIDEIGVLPAYRGTCVHDGWLSYTHYPGCRHALCGAHLLRELTFFEELSEQTKSWASPLKELLLEMKGEAEHEGAHVPA